MKTATQTTAKSCKRCHGEGMGQHSRSIGACYLCGRMPSEGYAVKIIVDAGSKRAQDIAQLRVLLTNATHERAECCLDSWLNDEEYGWSTLRTIFGIVTTTDADVAARARTAFARIGVMIPASMPPVAPIAMRRVG